MSTAYPPPPPSVPVRGKVQKTFVSAKVITGFMDDQHVQRIIGEYQESLDAQAKSDLANQINVSRAHVRSLGQTPLDDAILRPLTDPHIVSIQQDPTFQKVFSQRAFQFSIIDPKKLVALQVHVKPRADYIPSDQKSFLDFMLPLRWDVPVELSFIHPQGPIQILTSNPALQGVSIELDATAGKVSLSPSQHINLVQVVSLCGRYYLLNGYHRVFDCIAAGVTEIPALVMPGIGPNDITIGGDSFASSYVMTLPRPPLVADFFSVAAVDAKFRERRYGVSVTLQVSPINIGI